MARDLISVKISDRSVLAALEDIRRAGINPRSMLLEIGEDLAASTKQRFQTSTAPDGSKWAKNSPVTIARYVHGRKGTKTKDNKMLSKFGSTRWDSKKPLIGLSKKLSHTITYILRGHNELQIGSPMIYAATHQFGASKGEFGTTKRGAPIPWGTIPARPFLGLSTADISLIITLTRLSLGPIAK